MFDRYLQNIYRLISNDIGIDLGTANTLVYVKGHGIVINEPSVVAVNQKTGQVVAVGVSAKAMLGRTPGHILAVRPVVDGVISDFEVTEEMMAYLLNSSQKQARKFLGPRVVVGVPSGVTNVETRAVRDVTKNTGAREVHIVEQPMAAAIGIRLPIHEPVGSMIIDIGGGTTDIAVISLGGVVQSKNIKVAGDRFNNDIISYMRSEFKILIGEKTAENIKIAIGAVIPVSPAMEAVVKGRDLVSGLPREVALTDTDVREALAPSIDILLESVREVLEITPPEIVSDIMHRGIYLVGGGALLRGLDELLREYIRIPIHIAEDPLTAVARGTGIILEHFDLFKDVLIKNEDESSPDS
ncbi:MAG: rod shape-determining protein [Candidatus Taylorbacteria bacterium RIFCSPHIGHO2_01_FULL_45_63]|uniref:Cell shape-determining protein MreB n=1 Tax=Candidatus Taylorbacteria bacterium RIFCSPHIGHO2_02_FULL_45_35 TaxID=1802311 RepID=A0A1G2MW23_9BACT|nr:MAG: rod shape-determining protein [Candidatus Taylorbacteria bacterium RIFCSPHIGHO2_01_FULL_45_63]OHA28070.1 MAG: rod shape-determining protein [Candidatus Taylorbacteria bacterium RIFCSPHIGHO2_02_FULL_45_35]OHA34895.1 MAG: rod shape-determining protein [Candidatus Taylorbacteria bacterium RIFCSPLOWO2_01_FULL_45_34b]